MFIQNNYKILFYRIKNIVDASTLCHYDIRLLNETTVETVCLLSKLHEAKHHINVKVDMDELDLTSA